MYAKLINGVLQKAPNILYLDRGTVYNPSAETLTAEGYMEVVEAPYPEVENDEVYESSYVEDDGKILQIWKVAERPLPGQEAEPIDELGQLKDQVAALAQTNEDLMDAIMELATLIEEGTDNG